MTARLGCSGRYFTRTVLPTAGRDALPLAHAAIDVARLHRQRASFGWNSKYSRVNAPNSGGRQMRRMRPCAICAALQDFLLQLRAERDGAAGGDHGDERAGEECEG